jgi:2'-5' RNA ligase
MRQTMQKRLFIAIDPEPAILDTIFKLISTLKRDYPTEGMRYTAPQNLHLTLQFLGETDEHQIPKIISKIDKICQNFSEFDLEFANLGAFPSRRNPRIIWLGVNNPQPVTALAKAIISDTGLVQDPEKAQFSPHLTLGRVTEDARGISSEMFSKLFAKLGSVNVGTTRIREVLLYQSILKPGGPVYTVLSRHALKNIC